MIAVDHARHDAKVNVAMIAGRAVRIGNADRADRALQAVRGGKTVRNAMTAEDRAAMIDVDSVIAAHANSANRYSRCPKSSPRSCRMNAALNPWRVRSR